jgi:hypothetical protein
MLEDCYQHESSSPKIEIEEDKKIECSAVLPKDIYLVWDQIDKFLERSCRRSNGRHTIDTIYKQLIDNQAQLWVVYNTEENVIKDVLLQMKFIILQD